MKRVKLTLDNQEFELDVEENQLKKITDSLENKILCEEYKDYYGNSDPQYGGILTDLYTLPVGTKFSVANGWWEGEKLEGDYILVHAPREDRVVKLTDNYHSLYLN